MRKRQRSSLPRAEFLRRADLQPRQAARDPRRAAGLRAARIDRRVRRRHRQLDVAAAHRRLLVPAGLRRSRRKSRRFLRRQRSVRAEALPAGVTRRRRRGRLRDGRRLPRAHQPLPVVLGSRKHVRMVLPDDAQDVRQDARDHRRAIRRPPRGRAQVRLDRVGDQQRQQEPAGDARRLRRQRHARAQARHRTRAASLDRVQRRAQEGTRRDAADAQRPDLQEPGDPGARHAAGAHGPLVDVVHGAQPLPFEP